jgi:uncharacterized protein YndB with AHSA1/START domain
MIDPSKFKPNTVYVTYIAVTPERVWQALVSSDFTRQYFFGHTVEIEPKVGGRFVMRMPDGRPNVTGTVVEWSPPRRLSCTWNVERTPEMRALPECLVTYEIEPAGDAVKLTMSEAHQWHIPEALLSGGRQGWPAILSSLKSLLETGRALAIKMEPPQEMREALKALSR